MKDKDTARYEGELKDLLTKGYFMMADGTKSSDHQAKKKVKRAKRGDRTSGEPEEEKNAGETASG